MEDSSGALQRYKEADRIWRTSLSASHPYFVYLSMSETRAHWMAGESEKALEAYATALRRAQVALGDTDLVTTELSEEAPDFLRWVEDRRG